MKKKTPLKSGDSPVRPLDAGFAEIVDLIQQALDGVIDELARYLARTQPGLRGFTRANLFRMRQFHDTYRGDEKVASLVRQLPWSHHLLIMGQCKRAEEREFYVRMAIRERWGKRELERQLRGALFERAVLHPPQESALLMQLHPAAVGIFKDGYVMEFLGLPEDHSEADLHGSLLRNLGRFIVELGCDFCFVGSEYPVQVGGRDFALDLLFYHRQLNCLVAIELKVGRFEPEHLGKLELPHKRLLQSKLHEFYQLLAPPDAEPEPKTAMRGKGKAAP